MFYHVLYYVCKCVLTYVFSTSTTSKEHDMEEQSYIVLQMSGTWYVTDMTALKANVTAADKRICAVIPVSQITIKHMAGSEQS